MQISRDVQAAIKASGKKFMPGSTTRLLLNAPTLESGPHSVIAKPELQPAREPIEAYLGQKNDAIHGKTAAGGYTLGLPPLHSIN